MLQYHDKFGTVRNIIAHLFIIFYSFSLISPAVCSSLFLSNPNPLLSLNLSSFLLSPSLLFHANANVDVEDHFHADLSLTMVFLLFLFFCFWLWFDGWVGQWVGLDGDVWVQIVLARFDDGNDEVKAKVKLFEEARIAGGGFEAKELRGASGVEVAKSVGEEREDVGVGAEGGGLGWRGCGGCVVVAVGCWQLCVMTVDCL